MSLRVAVFGCARSAMSAAGAADASRARHGTRRQVMSLTFRNLSSAFVMLALTTLAAAAGRYPIFVLNSQDADVSIIDASTFEHLRRLPTGKEPHHLYLAPDEKSLIVANASSNSLTFIDPTTGAVQRTVSSSSSHIRLGRTALYIVLLDCSISKT